MLTKKSDKSKYFVIGENVFPMKKSKYAINFSPVHVSDDMSGKMQGIPSISTSCINNPICLKRMQDGNSICAHCFAEATLKRRQNVQKAMFRNTVLLTSTIIPADLLPVFSNVSIVRIESFGDVANVTQAINYINICKVNPEVTFAWWSKNMAIIAKAIEQEDKPKNLILVESSPAVNKAIKPSYDFVDKVFTVYSKPYIMEHNIDINCGARCCATCRRCYQKNTAKEIAEQLK